MLNSRLAFIKFWKCSDALWGICESPLDSLLVVPLRDHFAEERNDPVNLLECMRGGDRAAEQALLGGRARRQRDIDIDAGLEQCVPHRNRRHFVRAIDGDDRTHLTAAERQSERLE